MVLMCRAKLGTSPSPGRTTGTSAAGAGPSAETRLPGGPAAVAHAKRFCPDAALRAAIACSEVLGAYGWLQDTPLPRLITLAKMLQVVDGTAEVQRLVIGRELARMAAELD